MATKLLIVESPGKVKKLSQILGSDWLVKASMGHVRELAEDGEDSLGFSLDEDSVHCHFVARGTRGKETIQHLRSAVQQVKSVVLATDPDREGETIAWHLEPIRKILGVYDRQLNKPQSGQIPNKTGMTLPNESIPHGSG